MNGRIAELHRPGGLRIAEYPVPDPEPGGLVVRVEQATVCGSDRHVWHGDTDATGLPASLLGFGHEGFGRIVALGEGTTVDDAGRPLAVGDRVVHHVMAGHTGRGADPNLMRHYGAFPYFFSTFADHVWIGATRPVFRVPDGLRDDVLAPVNCAMGAAVQALLTGGVGFGSRVVVLGAGGLGLTAVAAARYLGAACVVAQDLDADRLELARAFGADGVVDTRETPDPTDRVALVKELTGGGADVVLDVAGVAALLPEGAAMLARGGTFVEVGLFFPGTTAPFDPSVLVGRRARLLGSAGYPPELLPRILAFLLATQETRPWHRLVGERFGLDRLADALDATGPARAVVVP